MYSLCGHKCHEVGLNPWVFECPVCGCLNPDYSAAIPTPRTVEELFEIQKKAHPYLKED
jgi:hypothetical protein